MQHEQETTKVAEMRRDAPGAAARAYMEKLNEEMEADKALKIEGESLEGVDGFGFLEREEEVEKTWGRGLEGLQGLQEVTEVVARLERAGRAADVVDGM